MSIRNKLQKSSPPDLDVPLWLEGSSETTKLLFRSASLEFERLKKIINDAPKITLKNTKLNLSEIARISDRDKSILSSRRQPELMTWIHEHNAQLEALLQLKRKTPRKQSKLSLIAENTRLKSVNNEALTKGLRDFVDIVLSSDLLNDRDKLARNNATLRLECEGLRDQIASLQKLCNEQASRIARLMRAKGEVSRIRLIQDDLPPIS